jgi:hypothetical protein
MTKWSMSGVSLSPMHNVGIYRTHWAIEKNDITGWNEKNIRRENINALRVQKLQSKRRLAHHDTAVADEGGRR